MKIRQPFRLTDFHGFLSYLKGMRVKCDALRHLRFMRGR